jgi:hypothetical protein
MRALPYLRYLLMPAHATVLIFIAVLSIGFSLSLKAGFMGIPLAMLLLSALFSYGYVLLEKIAHGAREPPVLAVEMLNPAHAPRPLFQLAVVLMVSLVVRALGRSVSAALATVLEILALAALPASIGALVVGDSIWQSIQPLVLWRIARAQHLVYLGIVAVVLLYGLGISVLVRYSSLPLWLLSAAAMFAWLSVFALIGGGLYEQRSALGHEPVDTPERRAERQARQLDHSRSRFLDSVYGQARGGNLAGAWRSIERELDVQHHALDFYDWLFERLRRFDDPRLAMRLAQHELSRALSRDNARATRIAQRALAVDPTFRPRSAAETLRVAELARLAGDRPTAQALLLEFERHFPGDGAIAQAAAMAEALQRR